MNDLTLKNIEPALARRLEARAAASGRSVEDEARAILESATGRGVEGPVLLSAFERFRDAAGGVELECDGEVWPDRVRDALRAE